MAILLVQTSDHTTLVHTDDPDVSAPNHKGWVRLTELPADAVKPGANKVVVRPLSGVEYLGIVGMSDSGQRAMEALRRSVVSVDGRAWSAELELMVASWPWDILSGLFGVVREVSEGPTRRRS